MGSTMLLELPKCLKNIHPYKIWWLSINSSVLFWISWISSVPTAIFSDNALDYNHLLTYLPTYLLTCLFAYLLTCLLSYLLTYSMEQSPS